MEEIIVDIETEYIKLDSLLKLASIVDSGGIAKELILDGIVYVNGQQCTQRGKKIRPGDKVEIEDYLIVVRGD